MALTFQQNDTLSALGVNFSRRNTMTVEIGIRVDETLDVAKVGQLTTRSSGSAGTLTMAASHGITTSALIDLYWSLSDGTKGSRSNVVVGTVATNSVPISGGAGDDLPANLSNITAMIGTVKALAFDGDDMIALGMNSDAFGATVSLLDASDAILSAHRLPMDGGGVTYTWTSASGVTNPVAADDVAKVRISHGDSTTARAVRVVVGINN